MIKAILQETIAKMKSERDSVVNTEVASNKIKVVVPHNTEIDNAKAKAISEVQADANAKIAEITKKADAAKAEYEAEQKAEVSATVNAKYDETINELQTALDKQG